MSGQVSRGSAGDYQADERAPKTGDRHHNKVFGRKRHPGKDSSLSPEKRSSFIPTESRDKIL